MTDDLRAKFHNEFLILLDNYSIQLPADVAGQICTYFYFLSKEQQNRNLTAYRTLEEFVRFHLLDTLHINNFIDYIPNQTLIDIGSGCGIPGFLLGILKVWSKIVLVESIKKKAEFIATCSKELGLDTIQVCNERAEHLGHLPEYREGFDTVTARALAALPQALELCAPFVKQNGQLILPRGMEDAYANPALIQEELGLSLKSADLYSLPGRDNPFRLLIYQKESPTKEKYPRKPGKIRKNPI